MTTSKAPPRPVEILLAEDNEDDVFLMREAIRHLKFPVGLHQVDNGKACLAFLRKEGGYAEAPTPDLLLLDLNMPVMDGRQVMAELVADPRLRYLPVVILTTSSNEQDIRQMYELRCSTFIVKPLDYAVFEGAIRQIAEYWFGLAALPTASR